ncbi:hypothetical protein QFC19_001124 [Naganishia cerealis]|uniref:Uncharacterized protein n=1 Tax=Naganishia cerealis TaxID=610337 RepID=A0ACC2WKL4_9TREE|nr:hypothetical protein QFC19_001124 [Naganishia cerealis]
MRSPVFGGLFLEQVRSIVHIISTKMGNSQSTSTAGQNEQPQKPAEQVIRPQEPSTSVQFAPSLISQLSSSAASSSDEPIARTHHDSAIMARLQAETERLRHEEAEIMAKISSALEKENLNKEKPGMSSELLSRDMEEVKEKLEKLGKKRKEVFEEEGEKAEVRKQRDAVVQCYLKNQDRPLDCWKEVEHFKKSVGNLEADFVASLR